MEMHSIDSNASHRFLFKPEFVAVTGHFMVRVGTIFGSHKLNEYTMTLIEQEEVDAHQIEIFMAEDVPYLLT